MRCRIGIVAAAALLLLAPIAGTGEDGRPDEPVAAELERLLWEAASVGPPQRGAVRAATALARLWQDDADALCHVTSVLAGLGDVDGATAGERDQCALQSLA
jgi:hypothetical protein